MTTVRECQTHWIGGSGAVCDYDSYQGMALAMPLAEAEMKSAPVRRCDRESRAPQGAMAP
jgi:hypothetical protein